MAYSDPLNTHDVRTGQLAPSAWGDVVRDDLEFLIEKPMVSAVGTTYQSVTSGGSYAMTLSNERFDTDAMHSTDTNNERLTIQTSGLYYVYATLAYEAAVDGYRKIQFVYNGSVTDEVQVVRGTGLHETNLTGAIIRTFNAGDYIVVKASHNVGSNLDVFCTDFGANYLRAY